MDMSVPVAPGKRAVPDEAKSAAQPRSRPNSSELDVWLEKAEAMGELKRITAEVSPDLEAAHITYLVGLQKSPALLFENIKGHPGHKALYNMIGCNLSRFCLMIGEEPVDHPLKAVQLLQQKFGRKMKPVEVTAAEAVSSQNIVEGEAIDIRMFPAQRMWPLDGGMYLGTNDAVVTMDPETGRVNVGTYRMMIKGPREIGVYSLHQAKTPAMTATSGGRWVSRRRSLPGYGIDPAAVPGSAPRRCPRPRASTSIIRASRDRRLSCSRPILPACRCRHMPRSFSKAICIRTKRLRKARSGRIHPRVLRPAERSDAVHAQVERLSYRNNPTLTCALMADGPSNECGLFWAAVRSAGIWADLAEARHSGHPGRVVGAGGRRMGHDDSLDQTNVCRPRVASDGARRSVHCRRLFRQIRHRGRR